MVHQNVSPNSPKHLTQFTKNVSHDSPKTFHMTHSNISLSIIPNNVSSLQAILYSSY